MNSLQTNMEDNTKPFTQPWEQILERLDVSPEKGLSGREAKVRLSQYGPNRLRGARKKSAWLIFIAQLKSLIMLLLGVAALLSFVFKEWIEGAAILVVIALNSAIGFFMEVRAVRSMEALKSLVRVTAKVRRDDQVQEVLAEEIVPGDIVVLEGGDLVPADIRLIRASKLQADESSLTGESVPVSKQLEPLPDDVPIADRSNMLFMGTAVTRGSGEGVVVATGMNTELGRISTLVEEAEEESTPIEKRLDQLGHRLIWVTLTITAIVAVVGILRGKELFLMVETAIALSVAAIPEGLPIVATIALARGMMRMARRNALINRLAAVETLGAVDVICTDKTGTLTENKMTVNWLATPSGDVEIKEDGSGGKPTFSMDGETVDPSSVQLIREILKTGVLCNNASLKYGVHGDDKAVGDPMEVALLLVGAKAGIHRDDLLSTMPEVHEEAFDPSLNMMATFHEENDQYRVAVKGAPESVLEVCSGVIGQNGYTEMSKEIREGWLDCNKELTERGFRVIALATKKVNSISTYPYGELIFLGLVGLIDPPREDVRYAIERCRGAGIRVVMVTGDHPNTARNVALAVGLVDTEHVQVVSGEDFKSPNSLSKEERMRILNASIFARVNPKQKLDLISIHQEHGSIVAMTGDGVNDAPALKKADIGIAMGKRGTQVAREAADMVLKDDAFSTIVLAIEQGRIIFGNIRKFALYLISCNVSEIMVVSLASLAAIPLPILPLQILFLNLVTDVFPALALGLGEGDKQIMRYPPRNPDESILTQHHWSAIGVYGLVMTLAVIGALVIALKWLELGEQRAVTVSFLTLAFAQLWHVFNMRDKGSNFLRNDVTRNPFVWGALGLCIILILAAVYVPVLAQVLRVLHPGKEGWMVVVVMSLIPLIIGQILRPLTSHTWNSHWVPKWVRI
ncbi:MAG TPA: cation-transporting P-type ATPase [Thermodesulfobacteriota bacterium]|nr:cation-transporting P-type ATPase [Thermodesulfobacteriota bacterium]